MTCRSGATVGQAEPLRLAEVDLHGRDALLLPAGRLRLSQKTVRNNVSSILAKLQVADRAQAIVRARDVGLGHGSRT